MNKLLIILLAICLVSVHAFVKRDAPATDAKPSLDFQKMGNELYELGAKAGEELKKFIDPKNIEEGFKNLKEGFDKLTATKKD